MNLLRYAARPPKRSVPEGDIIFDAVLYVKSLRFAILFMRIPASSKPIFELGLDLFPVENFGKSAALALLGLANGPADGDKTDEFQVRGRAEKL